MNSTIDETVNTILDQLFTGSAKQKADRLLLIQEHHNGAAQVTNARYLGGYSRLPVRDILLDALRQREEEVRAEERERAAKIADTEYRRRIGSTIHRRACTEIAAAIRRDSAAQEEE